MERANFFIQKPQNGKKKNKIFGKRNLTEQGKELVIFCQTIYTIVHDYR